MDDKVDLGDPLEAFVSDLVAHGRFKDRTSVLRESVGLLKEREHRLRMFDAAIERGLADVAAGRVSPAEEVFARLEARYGSMAGLDRE